MNEKTGYCMQEFFLRVQTLNQGYTEVVGNGAGDAPDGASIRPSPLA